MEYLIGFAVVGLVMYVGTYLASSDEWNIQLWENVSLLDRNTKGNYAQIVVFSLVTILVLSTQSL